MKFKEFFRKPDGFSLMEIMVAAGLLAVISVAVMQMNKTMSRGQATAEVKMEAIEIKRQVISTLSDKQACEHTLVGKNLGDNVDVIKNSNDVDLFRVGQKYGGNALELAEMKILDDGDLGGGMRQGKLYVKFNKLKKSAYGGSERSFETLIKVKAAGASAVIDECFDDTTGVISTANESSCLAIGGVWDSATSTCTISHFVKKSGDTMTGALTTPQLNTNNATINGPATATTVTTTDKITSPQFCSGTNCKAINELALANQSCPAGQVSHGVKADGTLDCKALQCPSSQYFAGLDSSNNPICRPYPTNTCPTNQYVTKVNSDGTVDCAALPTSASASCPSGQVIQSVTGGIPTCVVNGGAGDLKGKSCPTGQAITGFASDGSLLCGAAGGGSESPINCVGSWSVCKTTSGYQCGTEPENLWRRSTPCNRGYTCTGIQTYTITQPSNDSGRPCPSRDGETKSCSVSIPGNWTIDRCGK